MQYKVIDQSLYQVAQAEEKTAGGLLLTQVGKEKPSVGTVSILV